MGRFSKVFVLTGLLLVLGHLGFSQQVNTTSGVAVVNNTPASTAPIIAPPAIALPGSGTPVGAPVPVGVNDPRAGAGYVKETTIVPGAESYVISPPSVAVTGNPASAPAVNVAATTQPVGNAPVGFRPGIAGTSNGATIGSSLGTSTSTVADAAAKFKSQKAMIHARMITNQDIYALNRNNNGMTTNRESMPQSESLPQSDIANPGNASNNGVLDQRDLDKVNAALARSRAKQAAKDKAEAERQQNQAQPSAPKP